MSGCSGVTANTRVKIELWDDDLAFDDFIADLTRTRSEGGEKDIPNTGSFEWTMPYDVSDITSASGGNHHGDVSSRNLVECFMTHSIGSSVVFSYYCGD